MDKSTFNQGLLEFIHASPTPYHAVSKLSDALLQYGFKALKEQDNWTVNAGERYFVTRNDSSIIAFVAGQRPLVDCGWRMLGAHTDSPCLKLKPNPLYKQQSYWQLGVEVYGGVLLNPWFDRDLSLAGRVSFEDDAGVITSALIDFKKPIALIPSLAIHLDREVNNGRRINPQTDINPILTLVAADEHLIFEDLLLTQLKQEDPQTQAVRILDFELSLYDCQAPAIAGLRDEFIAASRLDNLLSCYVGLQTILQADLSQHCLLVCNDHEEVGSQSAVGAQGPMLNSLLQRLQPDVAERQRTLARSMMISTDNAHGIHPNFADKHDKQHGPRLNAGPVIKVNANQRYATNSETSAVFKRACQNVKVPLQTFVSRSDMACGSTIGPITAGNIGIKTLDVGAPTFAMHSIRELAGSDDAYHLHQALLQFQALDQVNI
jgi:aspartyl aminopeptidase